MVYYLGELVRAQLDNTYEHGELKDAWSAIDVVIGYTKEGKAIEVRLFNVAKSASGQDSELMLAVQYDGVTYGIPRAEKDAGRSMHILSLITQLIGLQKSSTEMPQTTTVRILQ